MLRPGRLVPGPVRRHHRRRVDLLTYRKASAGEDIPDLPADAFTAACHAGDDGREHRYDLADGTVDITVSYLSPQGF